MNNEQIHKMESIVSSIKQIEVADILTSNSEDNENDSNIIKTMSANEFLGNHQIVLNIFDGIINDKVLKILPVKIQSQTGYGEINILNELNSYYSNLKSKNIQNAEDGLKKIIYYQLIHGLVEKEPYRINEEKLAESINRIEIVSKKLEDNISRKNTIFEELEKKKENITNLIDQKKKELEQINQNLQTANQNTNQINLLLNKSTESNTKISSLLDQLKKDSENLKEQFNKQNGIVNDLIKKLEDKDNKFEESLEKINQNLKYVEDKKEYFEERNEYLNELIGREAAASLFKTFGDRKQELILTVNFWKWAVFATTFIALAGIIAVFTNLFGVFGTAAEELQWPYLLTNSLKTIPFFILLYFTIRQYNRERNFQEEYAFKSAVALTINAYSEMVDESNKNELILNSVFGIYQPPISLQERISLNRERTKQDSISNKVKQKDK